MSGHRGYEFLEFLVLEFGPILTDIGFPAAEEFVVVFFFNDAPNVLYM